MFKSWKLIGAVAAIFAATLCVTPAQAQATRTWISGVGDDANPCSRTAPCKTFAGAISKTAAGGEIDCLDPGGFGAVTITKSITLDCGGGIGGEVGSILTSGTNGITISAANTDIIKIRNMTINGIQKSGSAGLSGIKFSTGAALIVEHVGIFGFGGTPGSNAGIDFEPNVAARLFTRDVEIQYGLADGILIKPASPGGNVLAALIDTVALQNSGSGLRVDTSGVSAGTSGCNVSVTSSEFSGNTQFGVFGVTATTTPVTIMLNQVTMSYNLSAGVVANGSATTIRMGSSVVTGNITGVATANSGTLSSYNNNQVNGNLSADGTLSGTIPLQ
jgi:hypothetical protein